MFLRRFTCRNRRCSILQYRRVTSDFTPRAYGAQSNGDDSPKGFLVANVEGKRNISPFLLGLFEHFETLYGPKIGFFQPIAGEPFSGTAGGFPRHVELLHSAFGLADDPATMVGVSRRQCVDLLASGKEEELLDAVYIRYEAYARRKALVLIEGTHSDGPIYTPGSRLELNGKIAATLSAPVLLTLDARDSPTSDLLNRLLISKASTEAQHTCLVGAILNQALPAERLSGLTQELGPPLRERGIPLLGALPYSGVLGSKRLDEIKSALNAVLLRRHSRVDIGVDKVVVASGTLDATLEELAESKSERCLVACDASRTDLLLGLSTAHSSTAGPHIAAVLMTGAKQANPWVKRILEREGAEANHPPLLVTEKQTWEAAQEIAGITPDILPSSARKIEEAKALFGKHVDVKILELALETRESQAVTPKKFMRTINRICERDPQHIVLPEGTEPRVLRAAAEVSRKGLAHITLLGEKSRVEAEARRISVDISKCQIRDHRSTPDKLEEFAALLVQKRKHKGMTLDRARDLLMDTNYYGTLMAASGDADGMVSGSTTTTANTIRPALQVLKTKSSLVSSVFFMCLPTKVLVYGDCAVNTDPSPQELANIGVTSADTAAAFGIEPLVAFLSYSTLGSGAGPDVEKDVIAPVRFFQQANVQATLQVAKAVEIAKDMRPDLLIEGPIQYDAAVDPEVARAKVKGESQVAGKATVLIVPDLNVGNIVYKGLTRPVNDLSRGCSVSDIVNTVTCTGVQAAALKARAAAAARSSSDSPSFQPGQRSSRSP